MTTPPAEPRTEPPGRPAARPDSSVGHVRTADADETPPTLLTAATSADTVRTHQDTDTPDTPDAGVRIEYRARVRRDQVRAAIADAFDVISRAPGPHRDAPSDR